MTEQLNDIIGRMSGYDHGAVISERLGVGMWLWPGTQGGDPGPKSGEAKSPGATEQNAEEAHRARGAPRGAQGEGLGKLGF